MKRKKDELVKGVKNIEDKNGELLETIKGKTDIKSKIDLLDEDLTLEAIALIKETKSIEENVDYEKLYFTGGNNKVYPLDNFKTFEKLIKNICNKNMTINGAEMKQNKFTERLDELTVYPPRRSEFIYLKESVSKNRNFFYDRCEKRVYGFKNGTLLLSKKYGTKTDSNDQQPDILDTPGQKIFNDFFIQIKEEPKLIDMSLFERNLVMTRLTKCCKL